MIKEGINTNKAPQAIGTYSQAIRVEKTVYLSGQIPLDPATMAVVDGNIEVKIRRVFDNLQAVCQAAGGGFDEVVKLTVYLTDLTHFPVVNELMTEYFTEPYPARAAVGVAALPKGVEIEIDAVMILGQDYNY